MADEIKLKAPTVEQQVVVNINGEDKLKSFADTLDKISNNKNLQKYWKTQQDLINATADAYSNFQKKASKENASELIKVTNALRAVSGTDLSHILPDFDKISKSMAEAQKIVGNIDSAFSVKGFKEAFDSFETLRAYGIDIQKLFSHFSVSSDIGELQQNVRLLESEVEKLTRKLSNARNANEELRNELENFKVGSGFADKLDELDRLKAEMQNIRDEATQTFNQFLDANKIDRYDWFNDDRFAEYFEKLENGTLTASEAIRQFKTEYGYLLEESFKSNGNSFGLDQLQAFSTKLDSIFQQVEETSNKINDILSNGVIAKSVQNLSEDTTLSDSQRSIFGNILQDEEALKSIKSLFQKIVEESNNVKNTEIFNTEQFAKVETIFEHIESTLSAIKSVLVDVGEGEELSPLLKMLDDIREAASNIKLGLNIDLGSETSEKLDQNVSQATQRQVTAYQKLLKEMFKVKSNKEMFDFYRNGIQENASNSELVGIYKGIIKRAENAEKIGNTNIYKEKLGSVYDELKREIKYANAQLSRAEDKRSENGILGDLFGNSTDLSGVIEQLNIIVSKLDEISDSAKGFTKAFKDGLNVNASVEEIEKLTNRVKELENELAKVKTPTAATPQESNISLGDSSATSAIEQQKKDTSDIIKLTDNYGRELDEANSKLLKGTALLDEQGKLIRLYHGSDTEFDKFDLSRSNNQIYGKGAYLIESEKGAEGYGSVVTQWYANVRKVMNEEGQLTLEEAQKLYNEFGRQLLNIFGKQMDFDEFFDAYIKFNPEETTVVEKMKSLANYLGKDIGDLFQAIGYDAIKMDRSNGSFYTIFDPDRLIRFKEAAVETTSAVEKLGASASQNPTKDAFPGSSTETKPETEGMEQVEKATEEAIQAKKDFATANEGVQSSIDGSENPLKLEAELMAQIAKSAREAADAKKEFVEKQDEVQKEAKATADTFDNITNSSEKFSGNVEDNFNEIISIIKNTNQDVDDHIEKWKLLKQVGRIGDDAFSAKFQKNDGQTEDWYFKKNDSGTYDVDNKLLTTDYKNFEKIIISAENKLRDLESQRDAIISKSPNASTAGIDKQIAYQKNYVDILDQTAQALRQDNETLLKGAQIEAARNKAAQEYYLNKGAKDDVKNASRVASEEQKRQKSIDQTNRLLNKQQIIIDGIEKSYSKVANPDLDKGVDSQSDLIELANKKAEIQTLLNKLSGQNRNSSNEKEFLQVEKLISEYKQLATDKLKANNPSKQELGGQKLNVLLANQVTQYNKLISQSEKYGDITKEITDELKAQRDLIAEQDKNGIYVARSKKADGSEITANDYYKARDNYKIDKSILGSYEDNIKSASLDKYVNKLFSFQTKTSSYDATIARFENGGWTSPEYLKNIQAVKDAVQKYDALLNKIKTEQNGIASETDIQTLKEYESEIKKTIATVTNMSAAQKGYSLVSGQKELDKIRQILKENSAMSAEAKGKIKAYYREIESGNPSMSLDKIHGEIMKIVNAEAEAGRAGKRMWDVIKEKAWYGAANVIGTYFGVNDIFRYIQQGISTVRELDEAMTEVRKVSDATEASYAKFQKTIASTAKDIATTNKELLNSSADFLRLGYSLDQASNLAKNATLFVNVGDGVDITEATEDMITAMKAFDIQAEDSIKIVDDYNQIGNQFALSATDIGEAMKRSASALETGNNSFEQSISLITAMNEIVQNSENTGNSLKVLSLRLRGAKAELEDMQEDTDGLCESTSKLREQIQSLTGVDIMIDDNTFKSTTDIIKELGAVWDKLSDSSQAATLELIAGKSRANNIAALLKNYQQIDKVMESLGDAEGSAMRENEDIVNSINGRIKTLSATAEEFWKSFISTDLVKNAVSFATSFLNVITKIIDKFGVLPSLITPIVAILSAKNKNFGKLA